MNRKFLFLILKFITSAVLLWLIISNFELGSAVDRLRDIKYSYVLAASFVFMVLLVNNTVRWRLVLSAIHVDLPFSIAIKILYIATFFNQTLPSSIGGDAFKIFLGRKAGINLKSAINGVMLERVIALLGLILLVIITQPFLLARIEDHPAKYFFPLLVILVLFGIIILMLLDRLPQGLQGWRIVNVLTHLASDTKKFFLSPRYVSKAIFLGIFGNILIAMFAYLTFCALAVDVSILDCLVLIPPITLLTTLPISIAGWGIREGAMVGAFAFVGVLEGDAFIVSLLFGILNIIFAIPGGFLWLMGDHNRAEVTKSIK
jgi:uncharacterized protein (TIRG00374 family)